jgi:NADP-dependent 3-hydroxy acid dehydrogenase YdfG
MTSPQSRNNSRPLAIVTGASSGIGYELVARSRIVLFSHGLSL